MAAAPITALIIDDEPLARQELQYLLDRAGGVDVVAQGTNGIEAVDLIRTHRPEVVFLDVRMPGLDGFAVLRKLMSADRRFRLPEVVFATAFDQYAVKAFEVNAIDYLLKPFDTKRLTRTLDKLRQRLRSEDLSLPEIAPAPPPEPGDLAPAHNSLPESPALSLSALRGSLRRASAAADDPDAPATAGPQSRARLWDVAQAKLDALLRMVEEQSPAAPTRTGRVVVRTGSRLLLVDQKDVCFASIEEGRISVVTKTLSGDSNVRTLEELADQLDPAQFWRAHRSFLVNLQHIREVVPWFKSTYQLRMDDQKGTEIPVSRSQTKRLRELFNL